MCGSNRSVTRLIPRHATKVLWVLLFKIRILGETPLFTERYLSVASYFCNRKRNRIELVVRTTVSTIAISKSPFSFELSGENKVILEGPLEETSESLLPYFSWQPVSGASSYTLTLASDASISNVIYSTDAVEVFSQYSSSAPPLGNGITLYWQVIAKDENGASIGDASNVGSFNTPDGSLEIEFMFGD